MIEAGSGRLVVDGCGIEYRHLGPSPERAPTVVLLHEGLGCLGLWKDFPERLQAATGLGVFAFSRPGYGRSDPVPLPRPLDFMEREARTFLPRLLDAIGFRRGILLGHSDGASVATVHAGAVGDLRVRGLVLLAPHFFVEEVTVAAIEETRRRYETGDLRARLARWHDHVDVAFRGWCETWLDPRFRDWDLREYLPYIRVPMLIVQGLADPYGTLAHAEAAEAESYGPVDVLALAETGHAPHLERPDEVLRAVADFTDRLFRLHEARPPLAANQGEE